MKWYDIGKEKVAIDEQLLLDYLEEVPYECTCKHCTIKRIPLKTNKKCPYFWIALKRLAEDILKNGKKKWG